MSKIFIAAAMLALLAASAHAEMQSFEPLFIELDAGHGIPTTVGQQRALLTTAGAAVYYSPSPAYSPRASPPVYASPVPVASPPKASPGASPKPASPKASPRRPASPKPCKFAKTKNANTYRIVLRATGSWGKGRDALVDAANRVYKKYSQTKLKIKVTGPKGQRPKKPYQAFVYTVVVPVTPCVGFKEGMRASLSNALKKVKYSRSVGPVRKFVKIN